MISDTWRNLKPFWIDSNLLIICWYLFFGKLIIVLIKIDMYCKNKNDDKNVDKKENYFFEYPDKFNVQQ